MFFDSLSNKTKDNTLLTVFFITKKAYIRTEAMEILKKS